MPVNSQTRTKLDKKSLVSRANGTSSLANLRSLVEALELESLTLTGDLVVTGSVTAGSIASAIDFASGTEALPGISFTGDLDSGIYRIGANNIGVAVNATKVLDISTTGLIVSGALNYKAQVTDTGGAFATPVVLTAAQSGRVILVDDAAGLDFTLPAISASEVGVKFEFLVTTTITSNSFRVTAASGDLLRGGIAMFDFDAAYTAPQGAYYTPDESNDLIMTMNGGTTGGKKGTKITFTAITATGWFVDGVAFGDGVLATPFS